MTNLPYRTAVIHSKTGDSFKSKVLPRLLRAGDLLVTYKQVSVTYDHRLSVTTFHSLHNSDPNRFRRVVIDCRLPRQGTKALNKLIEFCKDKVVIFLSEAFSDAKSSASAMQIFHSAKVHKSGLLILEFSPFQHMKEVRHQGWGR